MRSVKLFAKDGQQKPNRSKVAMGRKKVVDVPGVHKVKLNLAGEKSEEVKSQASPAPEPTIRPMKSKSNVRRMAILKAEPVEESEDTHVDSDQLLDFDDQE